MNPLALRPPTALDDRSGATFRPAGRETWGHLPAPADRGHPPQKCSSKPSCLHELRRVLPPLPENQNGFESYLLLKLPGKAGELQLNIIYEMYACVRFIL